MERAPLRIPENWRGQDRQFVIQLERILDQVYKGKVDNEEMKKAVQKLSSIDSRQINYYTILSKTELTSSYVDVSTYNDCKLSDYEMIVIEAYRGDWCLGSVTIAGSEFADITGVAYTASWNGTSIEYDAKYKTDTSVSVKTITSDSGTQYIKIIGLKWD